MFFTIGHSDREPETVVEMLVEANVDLLVDVRAFPRSRSNPAFNIDRFPETLSQKGIDYRHCRSLGGRRKRQNIAEECNAYWRVRSFHNYADYALGSEFQNALKKLESAGEDHCIALMCSEAVWWRCHRRLIVDYLLAHDREVIHLMAPGRTQQAEMTDGAVVRSDAMLVYPAPDSTQTECPAPIR